MRLLQVLLAVCALTSVAAAALPGESEAEATRLETSCLDGDRTACQALVALVQKDPGASHMARSCAGAPVHRHCRWYGLATETKGQTKLAADIYRQSCEGREGQLVDLQSCVLLGRLHARGDGVEKDLPEAAELFSRACNDDVKRGCAELESLRAAEAKKDEGKTPEQRQTDLLLAWNEKSIALAEEDCWKGKQISCGQLGMVHTVDDRVAKLEAACKGGDLKKCRRLALMHEKGLVEKADPDRAIGLYRKVCDGGDLAACTRLLPAYLHGTSALPKDEKKAFALAQKTCDAGVAEGCGMLAYLTAQGLGTPRDDAKAFTIAKKACVEEKAAGCDLAGQFLMQGRGVAKDPGEAVRTFDRGCEGGDASSCYSMGVVQAERMPGASTTIPDHLAETAFRKGCMLGHAAACRGLGMLFESGRATSDDKGRIASSMYEQACRGGDAAGCTRLGFLFFTGELVPKDEPKSVMLFDLACGAGDADGCTLLAESHEQGRGGLAKDPAKAKALYERACQGGVKHACGAAKRLEKPAAK